MIQLRVLTVARWYPSHDAPGRGSFVADLVGATVRAGVDARVASFDRVLTRGLPERSEAALVAARAAYGAVSTPGALFQTPRSYGAPGVPVARIAVVRRPGAEDVERLIDDHLVALRPFVGQLAEGWRPDLIHAHTGLPDGVVAAEIGRALSIPVLVTEHASTIEADLADPMALERYRSLLEPGVRLLAVSPSVAERVASLLGVAPTRIEVLPNPVFETAFPLAEPGTRNPTELLWVGSLGEHKGIDVLLRSFAQVLRERPRLHLRLIGSERAAGDRARWRELAADLRILDAITMEGWLERGAVAVAMGRAGLFVHPSAAETFGVVAAEAILTGLPVVTRRSGGVPWIVELSGGFGRVADGDDEAALARAIRASLEEAHAVDAATARAALVAAVGEAAVARRALELYRDAVAGGKAASGAQPGGGAIRGGAVPGGGPGQAPARDAGSPSPGVPALPRVLVATGRPYALARVAELPPALRDRLVLVLPSPVAAIEGAEAGAGLPPAAASHEPASRPPASVRVRIREAAPIPPRVPKPRGRSPLARLRRRLWKPQPTPEDQLAAAIRAATRRDRLLFRRTAQVVAIDAPAAAVVAGLAADRIRLAPGALRWLADRWDARSGRG